MNFWYLDKKIFWLVDFYLIVEFYYIMKRETPKRFQ